MLRVISGQKEEFFVTLIYKLIEGADCKHLEVWPNDLTYACVISCWMNWVGPEFYIVLLSTNQRLSTGRCVSWLLGYWLLSLESPRLCNITSFAIAFYDCVPQLCFKMNLPSIVFMFGYFYVVCAQGKYHACSVCVSPRHKPLKSLYFSAVCGLYKLSVKTWDLVCRLWLIGLGQCIKW